MKHFTWFIIGFLAGVSTVVGFFVLQLWFFSPVRIVERELGWDLPAGVTLMWQRDDRGGFLGQGSALSITMIPSEFAQKVLAKCPPGFTSGIFDDSGLQKREVGIEGSAPVCFMRKEEPNRADIIVFSKDRLFHLRIDR